MTEERYRRVTYDITMAAAQTLVRLNPGMTFLFVSGAGTDSTERGRTMWARVKGATENALLRLPFKAAYMFRPAVIQPLHGIRSKTRIYRALYAVTRPLLPRVENPLSKVRDDDGATGACDDRGREERRAAANSREPGYQQLLTPKHLLRSRSSPAYCRPHKHRRFLRLIHGKKFKARKIAD